MPSQLPPEVDVALVAVDPLSVSEADVRSASVPRSATASSSASSLASTTTTSPTPTTSRTPRGASAASCVINIMNTVLGAGILALPFAFSRAGTLGGPALVALSAVLNACTMHMLSAVGRRLDGAHASFHGIAAKVLPARLWWAVDLVVVLLMAGLSASYLIVFSNLTSTAARSFVTSAPSSLFSFRHLVRARPTWTTLGLLTVAPLSYAESLDALKYTSGLAMGMMLYVGALVVALWNKDGGKTACETTDDDDDEDTIEAHCGGAVRRLVLNLSTLRALALTTFAYTAQTQVPAVANELGAYSQPKMDRVCGVAVGICAVFYCLVGYAGYETFGDGVQGDLLESYKASPPVTLARIAISVVVAFSYPLMAQPLATSATALLLGFGLVKIEDEDSALEVKRRVKRVVTTANLASSFSLALFVDDLGVVLSVIGATCSTAIAYVIPALAYVKVFSKDGSMTPHAHVSSQSLLDAACDDHLSDGGVSNREDDVEFDPISSYAPPPESGAEPLLVFRGGAHDDDDDDGGPSGHNSGGAVPLRPLGTSRRFLFSTRAAYKRRLSKFAASLRGTGPHRLWWRLKLLLARAILLYGLVSMPLCLAATFVGGD